MRILPKTLFGKALLAVAVMLLPILITFLNGYTKNKEHLKKNILDDITIIAEAHEGQVYQFFEMAKLRVRDFSSDKNIRDGVERLVNGDISERKKVADYLKKNKLPLDDAIIRISIISLDGRIIASTENGLIGKDVSHESFFIRGREGVSLATRESLDDRPEIAISVPLMSESGKKIAVLTNVMETIELNKVLKGELSRRLGAISWRKGKRKSLEIYLVENESKLMLTDSIFVKNAILKQRVDTPPVAACIDSKKEISGFYNDYRGVEVAGASMCIPMMGWTLIAEADTEEVLAPVMDMRRNAIAGGAIVIGLIAVMFVVFFRSVVARLRVLSLASGSIAEGNYNISVPADSEDEIGTLSRAFNGMANDIRIRTMLLKESEERLRAIIDNSIAVIYLKDLLGRYILVNRRYLDIFNLRTDQVIGKTDMEIFPVEIAALFRENDLKMLESRMPLEVEEKALLPDGIHYYISIKFPLFDPSGKLYAHCGISTDITERKLADNALRASEEKYRRLISNIPDVTWTADMEGRIVYISPNAKEVFGYANDEILKTGPDVWLGNIHPDDFKKVESAYNALFTENRKFEEEYRLRRKDGRWIWLYDRATSTYERDGARYADGVVTDITGRRAAEEKIRRLNRLYSVLSRINETIIRVRDEERLFEEACRILVEDGGFPMAWIGILDPSTLEIRPVKYWGGTKEYLEGIRVSASAELPEGQGPSGMAARTKTFCIVNDIENDPKMSPWKNEALKRKFRSSAAFPVICGGKVRGVVNIYSAETGFFNNEEIRLLGSLAADISFAIESIELERQGRRADEEMKLLLSISLAIKEADDFHEALKVALDKICAVTGWKYGEVWTPAKDGTVLEHADIWYGEGKEIENFYKFSKPLVFPTGKWLPGTIWKNKEAVWVKDVLVDGNVFLRTDAAKSAGLKSAFGIPIIAGRSVLAVWVFFMSDSREEDKRFVDLVSTITSQIGSAMERKLAEEARIEMQQRFEELMNNLTVGVYRNTPGDNGKFIEANPAAVSIVEAGSREELLGHNADEFYADRMRGEAIKGKLLANGFVKNEEAELVTLKGKKIWASITAVRKVAKDGNIFFDGVIEEITERKKLEEQLVQSQKMEAIGQLAGGIAHDFNNILTAVIGYGNLLLLKRREDNTVKTHADHIISLSERASNLTQGLLAFSRKQVMNPQPVDLNELVKRVEKILFRIIGEDIELKSSCFGGELVIKADSTQMEQVLMNLATNARDAMPSGGVFYITTGLTELGEEFIDFHGYGAKGKYALITVSDTGSGMDEAVRKKIFEPFFTTKEVGKGTGLGLSVVYGIIKQHDGFINVYSEPGRGTEFKIYLPIIESRPLEILKADETDMKSGTETVLLAEDEVEVRRLTRVMLEEFGYKVIEASNGEEAVELFIQNRDRIDILVFDMIMPKKNGKEAYLEIEKIRPGVKVLFTSGYAAEIMKTKGILDEGFNFITKPVSPGKFLRKIREVLDEER